MPFGAATVAARAAGAGTLVDPRPYAVGSLRGVYEAYPHIGPALPAMGYGDEQLAELAATIAATPCDVVVCGTPIDLGALLPAGGVRHPIRYVSYDLDPGTKHSLAELLTPWIERWSAG